VPELVSKAGSNKAVIFFAVPGTSLMCCYSCAQSKKPPFNFIRRLSLNTFHYIRSFLTHSIPLLSFVPSSFHFIPAFSFSPAAALCFVAGPALRARRFSAGRFYFSNLIFIGKNNRLKKLQKLRFRLWYSNSKLSMKSLSVD
jgi:hypothetical protein